MLFQIHELININLLILSSILSIVIGGWNALNQTQLQKLQPIPPLVT